MAVPAPAPPAARSANQRACRRAAAGARASLKGAVSPPARPRRRPYAWRRPDRFASPEVTFKAGRRRGVRWCSRGTATPVHTCSSGVTHQQPRPWAMGDIEGRRAASLTLASGLGLDKDRASTGARAHSGVEFHPEGRRAVSSATEPRCGESRRESSSITRLWL